jgi:hypothetical protein
MTACMKNASGAGFSSGPRISDLRNADAIIEIADLIMLLDRPEVYEPESPRAGEMDVMVVKNRYGPSATVTLVFQGHYSRVVDFFISGDVQWDWSFNTATDATFKDPGKNAE